jgi:hypothetical protein
VAAVRRIIGASLLALGAFLLGAGALTRFYVAPALIGAPADVYQVTRLRAENASYFDAPAGVPRTGATIVATNTVRGDPGSTHGGVVVWDSTTVVQDVDRGTTIELQRQRYAFDRRTGELRDCCGAAIEGDTGVRQSGVGLFWPVEVRKRGLELFDTATRLAWPVEFEGEERAGGMRVYRFAERIPETRIAGELPAVPPELLGRPGGGPAVPVDRYYRAEGTFWVDPRTGAPIDQRQHVVSTLRPRQGPGRLVVADMTLRMTPESRRDLRARSADGAAKIRLLRTVLPPVSAGAGLLLAAAGLLLAGRRRTAAR